MAALSVILNVSMVVLSLIFWSVAFIILYHLTRFGVGIQPKRFAAVFLFGAVALFGISLVLFARLDLAALTQV